MAEHDFSFPRTLTRKTVTTTTVVLSPERIRRLVGAPERARVYVEALATALDLAEDVTTVVVSWTEEEQTTDVI